LVGEPRMVLAVGRTIPGPMAAEAEFLGAWIADRPFAGLVREMENGHPAVLRQVDQAEWPSRRALSCSDCGTVDRRALTGSST